MGTPKGVWVARAPASHRPLHAKNPPPPLPVGGGAGGLFFTPPRPKASIGWCGGVG
jgi:hypothetical protein